MDYQYNIILTIASSLFVILLAFIVTKLIANRFTKLNLNGSNMRVIERLSLGVDKQLAIVAIQDKFYLISTTKTGIELIDKLDAFDIKDSNEEINASIDFKDILRKLRNKNR